jgi:ubiquinone/menaquinone biosynthesis C-methylase UbiE
MDADLRHSMLRYYDERAPEYEEAYVLGTGTASMPDPSVFRTEARQLATIVERCASGRLIDLACGTGYWLPHYAERCRRITLFDQSTRMLNECRKKITELGIADRCSLVCGDFFDHAFDPRAYDCALAGFFLSHLTEAQEPLLFEALERMLDSSGRFLILDSAWSLERARFNAKAERQERRLNDGTCFEIYKRYAGLDDIAAWAKTYGVTTSVEHFGTAFFAVSGRFSA